MQRILSIAEISRPLHALAGGQKYNTPMAGRDLVAFHGTSMLTVRPTSSSGG
jgi:hypothetical protein